MNKARRKKLGEAFDKLCEAGDILSKVKEEENEAMENLPDSFRFGNRGEEMQDYIDMIEEVEGYVEDAKSVIEQI